MSERRCEPNACKFPKLQLYLNERTETVSVGILNKTRKHALGGLALEKKKLIESSLSPCVLADALSGLSIMRFLGTRYSEYIHTDNVGTHLVIIRNVHTAWVVCSLTTRVGTQPLEAFKE